MLQIIRKMECNLQHFKIIIISY